jgi:hypothetical protein
MIQVITTTSLLQGSSLCHHCKESVLHPMISAAAVFSTSLNAVAVVDDLCHFFLRREVQGSGLQERPLISLLIDARG